MVRSDRPSEPSSAATHSVTGLELRRRGPPLASRETMETRRHTHHTVLFVDDDHPIRFLAAKLLQMGGYDVDTAPDGYFALQRLGTKNYDLIILDLMMPEMDGFAVLDVLRGKPETANIPVIVATAKELTVDEKSRLQGQIQSLMLKGDFLNDEFLEEVRALIR